MSWKTDLRLSDLDPARRLEITCRRCGNHRYETAGDLRRRPGLDQAYCDEAERALRCHDRFCRGHVRIALTHEDGMEGFVGGMA